MMFDRDAYMRDYYKKKYCQRKAEGRCVTCGQKLPFDCTTVNCDFCRKKQKYQNVAKVNISKLIAEAKVEAKAEAVREMQSEIEARCIKGGIYPAFVKSTIDQIAKEMVEGK